MENFVVSARKYRPTTFESVVGQQHITTTLKNAIKSNHLAQAFLFCGPRGVGKTTNARILAKTINCTNLTDDVEACNQCDSCKAFNQNASFNVHELDAASNNSVDDIRNLVDQVRYAPQSGKYKVYIIDEVHMLSNQAFNAFLKTLEEPPEYAIFILATTEKHKIIPTILSRCQIFDFNRITVSDIAGHLAKIALKENIEAESDALHLIAQKADGALRDALSIFDLIVTFAGSKITYQDVVQNLHILDYDYYFRQTDSLISENISEALLIFNEILQKGFDGHNFLSGLAEHFRNLLVTKDAKTLQLMDVSETVKQRYLKQSNEASMSFLLSGLNILSKFELNYKNTKNQRLHVEICLMKLAHLNSAIQFGGNASPVEKKKVEPSVEAKTAAKPKAVAKSTEPLRGKTYSQTGNASSLSQTVSRPSDSSLRSTAKLPNLNQLKNKRTNPSSEQSANSGADSGQAPQYQSEQTQKEQPLSQEGLKQAWLAYSQELERSNNKTWLNVMKQPFTLNETTSVLTLELVSTVQLDFFERFRSELLTFLKSKLKNSSLTIQPVISERSQDNSRPYTPQEKLSYLQEHNKHVKKLQTALGLDVNF
ncbi:DNA polymerase III subunit gamma/tau [Aureibacter tunicatorum]|uniref:DNA polymerase III subunit gamma/tau n=1 Tax=Aureibacter tunicatorum TaxID=866807 RepID=A0AAE3XLK7_9BACT|nr:DNA polymerase III subunit gamma/tau [Aureibacter tunicatorum]MDR6238214.1 DNA polymerase-3 subunit gamma/tau [Aureibacter tunicatorum]BDD03247.1 DNA polymerase III subunit gamma/tau [Aureibacter tunicatorum]